MFYGQTVQPKLAASQSESKSIIFQLSESEYISLTFTRFHLRNKGKLRVFLLITGLHFAMSSRKGAERQQETFWNLESFKNLQQKEVENILNEAQL